MMKNELVKRVTNTLSIKMGKTGLKLKKYSPEIALGAGIAGMIGTVILACKETSKAEEIIDRHHVRLSNIQTAVEYAAEDGVEYAQNEITRDKFIGYSRTCVEFARLYAPAVILGATSIGLILWSHGLMKKRYLGVVAAYNAVNEAFRTYRERVRAEGGDALDRHYLYGTEYETNEITTVDENGKKKKEKETVEVIPDDAAQSEFTRLWGPGESKAYMKNVSNSRMFLQGVETVYNNILNTRGYVWLNEVLDALGYDQTSYGAVTGWIKDDKGGKDGYIDLGIHDLDNPVIRRWTDGSREVVTLNFNVDGVILDLVDQITSKVGK